jgi:hypothetical protein
VHPFRSRGGWLGVIRAVLLLMLIGDILAVPALLLSHGLVRIGHADVGFFFTTEAFTHQRRHSELDLDQITLALREPTRLQELLYVLGHGLAATVAAIPMIIYARRVAVEAATGDPFTPGMVRRLRTLGAMVLVGGLLAEAVAYLSNLVLLRGALPDDDPDLRALASPDDYTTLWWLLPGLILLAVSQIVKRGCDLRAELDGVI